MGATCQTSKLNSGTNLVQWHHQVRHQWTVQPTSWVAAAFGDCKRMAHKHALRGPFQYRNVTCQAANNGSVVDGSHCRSKPRPRKWRPCSCELMLCRKHEHQEHEGELAQDMRSEFGADLGESRGQRFAYLGCLPLSIDSPPIQPLAEMPGAMDTACVNFTEPGPCRLGLPFFRWSCSASQVTSPQLCFEFCIGNGLDIFGFINGTECRCGASALNRQVWGWTLPNHVLQLPWDMLERHEGRGDNCQARVYRYTGFFEDGGAVPVELAHNTNGQTAYLDSFIVGHEVAPEEEEDVAMSSSKQSPSLLVLDVERQDPPFNEGWSRPGPSSQAGRRWSKRQGNAPGGTDDVWQDYVIIDYTFNDTTDDVRKESFRKAVEMWRADTCIRLVEGDQANLVRPYTLVGAFNTGSCSAYLGETSSSMINLGWCKDSRHIGNMAHEIGHVLGMNHEQKRPDGAAVYYGKGPHLQVYWENIPANWVSQYTGSSKTYTGSTYDGPDDAQVGYAEYDFESIMHYGGGNRYDTVPASSEPLVGNRDHLSDGDIKQILDVYQCKRKPTGPTTTPAPVASTSCGFETGFCKWTTDGSYTWTIVQGATPSSNTGPTGAAVGTFYAYIEASDPNFPSKTFALQSPYLQLSTESVLTFKFHMYGSSMGSLAVEAKAATDVWTTLWEKAGDQGEQWQDAAVQVPIGTTYLRFVGTTGSGYRSDMAIDEMSLAPATLGTTTLGTSSGPTSNTASTTTETTTTTSTTSITSSTSSTATTSASTTTTTSSSTSAGNTTTPSPPVSNMSCDFEAGFCNWVNTGSNAWITIQGSTPSSNTGPTQAATSASYAYVEASSPNYPSKTFSLQSPSLKLSAASVLAFKFHMYGATMGSLSVEAKSASDIWTTLWERAGNQGQQWQDAAIQVSADTVYVRFVGITGSSWSSDIAIDALSLAPGVVTTITTTTPVPVANTSCDFEAGFCNWVNTGSNLWTIRQGTTPSSNTGPTAAATGTSYAYVEASSPNYPSKIFSLQSPVLKLSAAPVLAFKFHMYGATMGSLFVEAKIANDVWTKLWEKSGDQGQLWQDATVQVPAEATNVRFVGTTGSSWSSDIAIDAVSLTPGSMMTTQTSTISAGSTTPAPIGATDTTTASTATPSTAMPSTVTTTAPGITTTASSTAGGPAATSLEVRSVVVSGTSWSKFSFEGAFSDVPVVVVLPSSEGSDPAAVRIRGINASGFEAAVVEPAGNDGTHVDMNVTYLAARPGVRLLGGTGLMFEAGRISTKKVQAGAQCRLPGLTPSWETISFVQGFSSTPALLTTVQTLNNENNDVTAQFSQPWLTVAVTDLKSTSARLALELAETSMQGPGLQMQEEDIGYVALEQGTGVLQSSGTGAAVNVAAVLSPRVVRGWDNGPVAVSLSSDLGVTSPLILASQSSRFGGDGGWLRLDLANQPPNATHASFFVDEDQTCNVERQHTTEQVSVVAFSGGASL